MRKSLIIAVVAGILCSLTMAHAQTKIRAEGMAVIINNRVDIARDKALDGALRRKRSSGSWFRAHPRWRISS
jgi:hypothetical protein